MKHLLARLRALFRRDVIASEIRDELQFHMDMRAAEYERNGEEAASARRRAAQRVGNIAVHQDRGYDIRGGGFIETIVQDVRYALRLWRKQPGFAAGAIVTLALGIGISTALFSVIDAALLRPLPFPHPEQLVRVMLEEREPDGHVHGIGASLNDTRDWRGGGRGVSAAGIIRTYPMPIVVDAGGGPERVTVSEMADGCLEVFQLARMLGRGPTVADLAAGAPPVVLLGYGYWQNRFGGSRDVIGRTLRFIADGPSAVAAGPATIIGVLPAGFYTQTALWRPPVIVDVPGAGDRADRRGMGTDAYARLRPGVSLAAAAEELTAVSRRAARDRGQPDDVRVDLTSLAADTVSGYGPTIGILASAVGFVLLIACTNVAGLLMARGAARRPEMAVRTAIGAGRGRLIRQLLTESVVLALAAGALGALLAGLSLASLVAAIPLDLPESSSASLNLPVLLFAFALSVATSLVFGLIPAIAVSRTGVTSGAIDSRRGQVSRLRRRGGQWFIGVEVAVALVLLAGAGLMLRSLNRAMSVDIGFNPDAVIVMKVAPLTQSPAALSAFYPALLDRLRAHSGVAAAGAIDALPLDPMGIYGFASSPAVESLGVMSRRALPGYVEAMGLTVLDGHIPAPDEFDAGRAAILNKAAAAKLFPDGDAVGKTIIIGFTGNTRQVAAVTADVKEGGPLHDSEPEVTELMDRRITSPMIVVIRPTPGTRLNTAELRDIAQGIGPPVFIDDIVPASHLVADTVARPRHRTLLFSLLGGLGLVLTLVGIFGATAYAVARRTQEIGVRMAFGASPRRVVRTIVMDAAWPVVIGMTAGVGGAMLSTKVIAKFLFQTTPTDPATFAAVAIVLGVAGVLAAWLPARRAARIDPIAALRSE